MAKSQKLQCHADEELDERVDTYQKRNSFEHQSNAVRELIRVGLRESRSPLLYRFKDRVVRWSGDLAVFGILAALIGLATPVLSAQDGIILAAGLVLTAVCLLAVVEVARLVGGTNATGWSLRRALSDRQEGDS